MPLATLLLAALPFGAPLCGQTWRPVGPAGGISGTLAASASEPGLVYLLGRSAGDNGSTLYRSANGGQSWQRVPGPALDALLAVDARSASTLYGRLSASGGPRQLAKSVDGGRHWAVADRGLEAAEALQPVGAPVHDPGNPRRLLTPTLLGLFESTKGAASWHVRTLQDTPV
ncbi:MAG TPA: sialidase family protein, partial [Thermoanaerobaculia bacterium]|nr:sialidase family protein [Thermoanaerobaculia bacterium]